jgi:hypothetical protein
VAVVARHAPSERQQPSAVYEKVVLAAGPAAVDGLPADVATAGRVSR